MLPRDRACQNHQTKEMEYFASKTEGVFPVRFSDICGKRRQDGNKSTRWNKMGTALQVKVFDQHIIHTDKSRCGILDYERFCQMYGQIQSHSGHQMYTEGTLQLLIAMEQLRRISSVNLMTIGTNRGTGPFFRQWYMR